MTMPGPGEGLSIDEITALLSETAATARRSFDLHRAHEKLKDAMGGYYFGPEDWEKLLGVKGVELPDIPSGLTLDLLERPDEFEPTKTIAETHALVVIPRGMSLLSLGEKVTAVTLARKVKALWTVSLAEIWKTQPLARKESSEDTLVLIRRDFLPGSQDKTDEEQEAYLATDPRCSPYETASMLYLQAMLFLNFLKNKERLFFCKYGRCEEKWDDGQRAYCGVMSARGVYVSSLDSYKSSNIGRAVRWRL